jgi:hypothetical protein
MTSSMIRQVRNGKMIRRFGLRSMRSLPAFDKNGCYIAAADRRTYAMWLYV